MGSFIGGFIGDLLVNGAVSASEQAVYNWSYIFCFSAILVVYFFLWYKIYRKIKEVFLNRHFSRTELFIIICILTLSLFLFLKLWNIGFIPNTCESFGVLIAHHVHLPGYGEGIQINLDPK